MQLLHEVENLDLMNLLLTSFLGMKEAEDEVTRQSYTSLFRQHRQEILSRMEECK